MKSSLTQTPGLSVASLVLGGIIIGLSPIFVRLSELGPVSTAFWRVGLAMLPLLAWQAIQVRPARSDPQPGSLRDAVALTVPGVMLAGDLLAWHISIHVTSVANATLLANMSPIFVVLGGWLLFANTVSRAFLAGLALAICGVVLLNGALSGGSSHLGGDAIAVLAAVFYAGYILTLSRLRSRYSTLTTLLWSSATAAVCILPVALLFEPSFVPVTIYAWAIVLALALLCHVGGQGLIVYALALLPASFSSLTLLTQPIIASCVAWIILDEPLGAMQAAGGVIVIGGILVARRG